MASTLRLVIARPSSVATAALLLSLGPFLTTATSFGINTDSSFAPTITKELAIVGFAVGALRALAVAQPLYRSLEATAGAPRTWIRALVLAGSGTLHAMAATLPMLLVHGGAAVEPGYRVGLACFAITALGCLLLRLDLRGSGGPALLAVAVLVGPMALPQTVPDRSLLSLSAALLLAAWLLDHPPERPS